MCHFSCIIHKHFRPFLLLFLLLIIEYLGCFMISKTPKSLYTIGLFFTDFCHFHPYLTRLPHLIHFWPNFSSFPFYLNFFRPLKVPSKVFLSPVFWPGFSVVDRVRFLLFFCFWPSYFLCCLSCSFHSLPL